jgi:hypothetical protein
MQRETIFAAISAILFVSMAFVPVINADVNRDEASVVEYREVSVEIHTPNGMKTITEELPLYVVERITELVSTRDDVNKNELLSLLKAYGLLGDYSVERVKNLITGDCPWQKEIAMKMKGLSNRLDPRNRILLVNTGCYFLTGIGTLFHIFPRNLMAWALLLYIGSQGPGNYPSELEEALTYAWFIASLIPVPTTIGIWNLRGWHVGNEVHPAHLMTFGLLGKQGLHSMGNIFAVTFGFTGIIIHSAAFGGAIGFTPATIAVG